MMPQLIENTDFKVDSSNFLFNHDKDPYLAEFEFILIELKKSEDMTIYKTLPDITEPQ